MQRAIRLRARAHVDFMAFSPCRDPIVFEGPHRAWAAVPASAGARIDDLDLVETHDCFQTMAGDAGI